MTPEQLAQELSCDGVLPVGPCSGWPRARHEALLTDLRPSQPKRPTLPRQERDTKVKATASQMAKGLIKNAATAMTRGRVAAAVREERLDTCKACPHFIEASKRCSECGCMMEAKSWINGNPKQLCPKQKWAR